MLEGQNVDHGESSRAGEQDSGESGYGAAKKGKRRKPNPWGVGTTHCQLGKAGALSPLGGKSVSQDNGKRYSRGRAKREAIMLQPPHLFFTQIHNLRQGLLERRSISGMVD